jgi:hypothetical protein
MQMNMISDPEKSLSDNLADLGCTHRPSKLYGCREIIREDGTLAGTFDAKAAWEELCNRPAIFKPMEPK